MRILFFSHYFPPESNAPAVRTHAHCRRWAEAGHDVTVVTCVPNHPRGVVYPGYRRRLRQTETLDGIRVVRVPTHLAANAGVARRGASWLSYLAAAAAFGIVERRPDVVIATSPQFFCGWAGVLVAALRRRPLVLEIRDLWPASIAAVGGLRNRAALWSIERLERLMYASARHIVTVGDGYRAELTERGVAPERLSVVTNGVDTEVFRPRPPDARLREKLGLGDRFVVAWCGTIGMAHGLDVVLRAAARLHERGRSDVVFLLAGDGARLDALRAEAARLGLDNVIFAGQIDHREIPDLLAVADAFLVHLRSAPLFATVLPSKIFEGAAMGLPLLAGLDGFARRLVDEAGAGRCFPPEDDAELAEAVLQLAGDPSLRRRLGAAGHALVAREFDRDALAARYLDIVERTAAPEASLGA